MKNDIVVDMISRDKLSKQRYVFTISGVNVTYTSFYCFNRSSIKSVWPDEQPEPKSFEEWRKLPSVVKELGKSHDIEYDSHDPYMTSRYCEYANKLNPVAQKTRDGCPKVSGVCAMIAHMPVCPESVAKRALLQAKRRLKVVYK